MNKEKNVWSDKNLIPKQKPIMLNFLRTFAINIWVIHNVTKCKNILIIVVQKNQISWKFFNEGNKLLPSLII